VILVDFWATWCKPCIHELPNLQKTYQAQHEDGFEVIAISLDTEEDTLRSFVKARDLPWNVIFGGKGWDTPLAKQFGVSGIPATFLIGKDGSLKASALFGDELPKAVAKAMAE